MQECTAFFVLGLHLQPADTALRRFPNRRLNLQQQWVVRRVWRVCCPGEQQVQLPGWLLVLLWQALPKQAAWLGEQALCVLHWRCVWRPVQEPGVWEGWRRQPWCWWS